MAHELYQEYLLVIGKLKDAFKFDVDVEHQDIHTFYRDKRPLFKLFFGSFQKDSEPSIVVSFHLDLPIPEAIAWYINIYRLYPVISMHDSYIEDANGETYLGEDALALREVYQAQEILNTWLEGSSREEMEEFAKAPVVGRQKDPNKSFNSHLERVEATIEFDRIRKPGDDDQVH